MLVRYLATYLSIALNTCNCGIFPWLQTVFTQCSQIFQCYFSEALGQTCPDVFNAQTTRAEDELYALKDIKTKTKEN